MLKQQIHPKIVQERLGHSTMAITLDTYSHVTLGLQEAAALRFDEGLAVKENANRSVSIEEVPLANGSFF
jgi:integrase